MEGMAVREPVARIQRFERMRRPATSASSGETKRARPWTMSTPMPRKRSGESCGSMRRMMPRTRSITAAKSARPPSQSMP